PTCRSRSGSDSRTDSLSSTTHTSERLFITTSSGRVSHAHALSATGEGKQGDGVWPIVANDAESMPVRGAVVHHTLVSGHKIVKVSGAPDTKVSSIPSSDGSEALGLVSCARGDHEPMNAQGTALITGASSGIGAVYADRLAKRGYDLVLVGRDEERLRTVSRRIAEETGRSTAVMVADLTARRDLLRVEDVLRTETSVTMLVNNAGIAIVGNLADADPDRLEQMVALNVLAPTRLARAVLPAFIARARGTIVNISSAVAVAREW